MAGGLSSVVAAFGAGVLSFLSPCVLPLIPAYISFLGGTIATNGDQPRVLRTLWPAVLFIAGFSIVFISLGASASVLGALLRDYRDLLARASGVLIVIFGVLLLGVLPFPWLQREARFDLARSRSFGRWAALVMGMAFAFGWTPCVGPILGSILLLAGSTQRVGEGVGLLAAYSAGLALPFLGVALLLDRLTGPLKWLERHALVMERIGGVVLIAFGLAVATGTLGRVVSAIPLNLRF